MVLSSFDEDAAEGSFWSRRRVRRGARRVDSETAVPFAPGTFRGKRPEETEQRNVVRNVPLDEPDASEQRKSMREEHRALEALRAALQSERHAFYSVACNPSDSARLKEAAEAARQRIDAFQRWLEAVEDAKTRATSSG
jgi:hypothetical protein